MCLAFFSFCLSLLGVLPEFDSATVEPMPNERFAKVTFEQDAEDFKIFFTEVLAASVRSEHLVYPPSVARISG